MHLRQENEKRRQYEERVIHVGDASFTPLLFTIAGCMGKVTRKCFSRLAEILAKPSQPKNIVIVGMRCWLSFSLHHSAILCIRGTGIQQSFEELHYIDIEGEALVGHISRSTYG